MIKFDYFHYLLGSSNLEYKINLLYSGKNDCILLGKFVSCYIVDKIKDVNKYLYNSDINYVLNKQYTKSDTEYCYKEDKNNGLKYVLLSMMIPAIELTYSELEYISNIINMNKNSTQSKYYPYYQNLYKYNSNDITNNEVNFILTNNIHTTYLIDISNFKNYPIYPAYIPVNNKHYLVLLPNPMLFNTNKSNITLTTGDKYFTEMYSLEELNLCLEEYTKQTYDKFNFDNIISL